MKMETMETMETKESLEKIMEIIGMGTSEIIGEEEIREKIKSGKKLILKLGLDPTAPDIHLGHTVVLRKIRQFQDMGHSAVIIIGDFTAAVGDPSGKQKMRPMLDRETILENSATYLKQIFKVLDESKTEVRFNSEWLGNIGLPEMLKMASSVTVARMMERDDFEKRFRGNIPIGLHEFFYPLLQARDSVEIKSDIEFGGSDQTFNILMGRSLMRSEGMDPQSAIFMPLLEGLDGKEKMSKSLGNYIGVSESPEVMFRKCMEIPDSLIIKYFILISDFLPGEIKSIEKRLSDGENPRDIKFILAENITRIFCGEEEALKAEKYFREAFTEKGNLHDAEILEIKGNLVEDTFESLTQKGVIKSKSELRRLTEQGGFRINGEKALLSSVLRSGDIIKTGKKDFFKISISEE